MTDLTREMLTLQPVGDLEIVAGVPQRRMLTLQPVGDLSLVLSLLGTATGVGTAAAEVTTELDLAGTAAGVGTAAGEAETETLLPDNPTDGQTVDLSTYGPVTYSAADGAWTHDDDGEIIRTDEVVIANALLDDAGVRSTDADANFGSADTFTIWPGNGWISIVKMDLSLLGGPDHELAQVFLEADVVVDAISSYMIGYETTNSWDEATVTYNTLPAKGIAVDPKILPGNPVRFDVSRPVLRDFLAGETETSIIFESQIVSHRLTVASKEHATLTAPRFVGKLAPHETILDHDPWVGSAASGDIDRVTLGGVDYQALAWWGFDRVGNVSLMKIAVRSRGGGGAAWSVATVYEYAGTVASGNFHHRPKIGFDANGFLHVEVSDHGGAPDYRVSDAAIDTWAGTLTASSFVTSGAGVESSMSYPTFTRDPLTGDFYMLWRSGSSSSGKWYLYAFDLSTGWAVAAGTGAGGLLLSRGSRGGYIDFPIWSTDGRMALGFVWRDGSAPGVENEGYNFLWYDPSTPKVTDYAGNTLAVPVGTEAEIYSIGQGNGLSNQNGLDLDEEDEPHISYLRNSEGEAAIHYLRNVSGTWTESVVALTGADPFPSGVADGYPDVGRPILQVEPDGTLRIFCRMPAADPLGNILAEFRSSDAGATWSKHVSLPQDQGLSNHNPLDISGWRRNRESDFLIAPRYYDTPGLRNGLWRAGAAALTRAPSFPDATFDGANDLLRSGGNLVGHVDGKQLAFVCIVERTAGAGLAQQLLCSVTTIGGAVLRNQFGVNSSSGITIAGRNSSGTILLLVESSAGSVPVGTRKVIYFSCDLSDPLKRHLYIGDVSDLTVTTYSDASMDLQMGAGEWAVGARASGADKLAGLMQLLWYENTYIDFSVEGNRRKYATAAGVPVYLGKHGEIPTGSPPAIFFAGDFGRPWATNRGDGGAFTLTGSI